MLDKIIEVVNELSYTDIRNKSRTNKQAFVRAVYYQIAYYHTKNNSLSKIGSKVGKSHATVLHGLKIFKNELYYDEFYKQIYEDALKLLGFEVEITEPKLKDLIIEISDFYDYKYIQLKNEYKFIGTLFEDLKALPTSKQIEFRETRMKPFLQMNSK